MEIVRFEPQLQIVVKGLMKRTNPTDGVGIIHKLQISPVKVVSLEVINAMPIQL